MVYIPKIRLVKSSEPNPNKSRNSLPTRPQQGPDSPNASTAN
uniref:Uncharacterized protein n=1 Tax=Heterorhabditis bacteriophora TaxID=37862 RepID=A0A1I7X258_HETBA